MPARKVDDPLVVTPVRLPQSVVTQLRAEAEAKGASMSDVLRSRLAHEAVKPLGRPTPRKRAVAAAAPKVDPVLLRELAKIGNNLNQIGRWCNTYKSEADTVQVLRALVAIERRFAECLSNF
ncbi:MAG: plasmid mobilization relaxosome protein MobC [Desulfovibrionales bacterium]|nr:MAG: plasmid mobilization relaxosome protein MobC [Desulfovibrionales bacterium]